MAGEDDEVVALKTGGPRDNDRLVASIDTGSGESLPHGVVIGTLEELLFREPQRTEIQAVRGARELDVNAADSQVAKTGEIREVARVLTQGDMWSATEVEGRPSLFWIEVWSAAIEATFRLEIALRVESISAVQMRPVRLSADGSGAGCRTSSRRIPAVGKRHRLDVDARGDSFQGADHAIDPTCEQGVAGRELAEIAARCVEPLAGSLLVDERLIQPADNVLKRFEGLAVLAVRDVSIVVPPVYGPPLDADNPGELLIVELQILLQLAHDGSQIEQVLHAPYPPFGDTVPGPIQVSNQNISAKRVVRPCCSASGQCGISGRAGGRGCGRKLAEPPEISQLLRSVPDGPVSREPAEGTRIITIMRTDNVESVASRGARHDHRVRRCAIPGRKRSTEVSPSMSRSCHTPKVAWRRWPLSARAWSP